MSAWNYCMSDYPGRVSVRHQTAERVLLSSAGNRHLFLGLFGLGLACRKRQGARAGSTFTCSRAMRGRTALAAETEGGRRAGVIAWLCLGSPALARNCLVPGETASSTYLHILHALPLACNHPSSLCCISLAQSGSLLPRARPLPHASLHTVHRSLAQHRGSRTPANTLAGTTSIIQAEARPA